jgi:hypothetical protein
LPLGLVPNTRLAHDIPNYQIPDYSIKWLFAVLTVH